MVMATAITRELFQRMQTRLTELDRSLAVANSAAAQAKQQLSTMGCPNPDDPAGWLQQLATAAQDALTTAQQAVAKYEADHGPI
jgi:hypothetical protein